MELGKKQELELEAKRFFEAYKKEIGKSLRGNDQVVKLEFDLLSQFSPLLSEKLIETPEEILSLLEMALSETGLVKNPRIRLENLIQSANIKIKEIRAKHLDQLIVIEGIVRQSSDVRPQVVNAKFECPTCGAVLSVLQIDRKFREPSRCSCGRKGLFKLLSKEMVDAQRIVIEESPDSMEGGEQPKRMNVFLKEDLVDPKMEERTTPGSKVKIIGILKEVPVPLPQGSISTRFDLAVEANNAIPLEETFDDLEITDEDEEVIKKISSDPRAFEKLASSIAPSVYGFKEVKEAILLQLFSGVKKKRSDGGNTRGDIHILLVGDPGVAKSIGKEERIMYFTKNETGYDKVENIYNKFKGNSENLYVLTIDMKSHEPRWEKVGDLIKHLPEKDLIKITTEHGKTITATKDHSFITLSKLGEIISIKGEELINGSFVPIPINYHKERLRYFLTHKFNKKTSNSKILPDKIKLDKDFGFFLGIYLSEGYIKKEKIVDISNKNREIQNRVIDFSKKLKLNYYQHKNGVSVFSKNLCSILKAYCYEAKELKTINKGVKGNYSRLKKIPEFLFFAPREFIYGLISGLFSGDGRLIKDKKMLKGFELITVSKNLAEGTSDLLFSIGIINKIKTRKYNYNQKETEYYSISVPTYMIKIFLKHIEFLGRKIKINSSNPIYSYNDLIPCGDILYQLVKKLGYNRRINGDRTLSAEMRTVKKRNCIGRLRLLKLIKKFELKSKEDSEELKILKKVANSNIVWSRVEKIKVLEKKNEEVYDLSIPSTNTFVSNGIGVHNSVTLKFVSRIAPKGRYVSGKAATGAGLTAAVVKDEFLKGWSLEAGAMVLSNKGTVCLHPDSNIIIDNKIIPISSLFNEEKSKKYTSNNEHIEVCDINVLVPSAKENKIRFENKQATLLRRKKYDGNLINLDFESGLSLSLTPDHKIIDGNTLEWKEVQDFKKGDFALGPLKLPENDYQQYLLEIIPLDWYVQLDKDEKTELKEAILLKYKNLKDFNKIYSLDSNYLSGGKQLKIKIFREILKDLNLYESWKERRLSYGRSKGAEKLKITKITPELAYIIGFTLGDGSCRINNKHSLIQITQGIKNIKQINKIKEMFSLISERKIREYKRKTISEIRGKKVESECISMKIPSNLICFLYNHFTKNNLSNLLSLSNECLKAFFAGCMDSDGCISIKSGIKNQKIYQTAHIEFVLTNNERINKNLVLALRRLDCYAKSVSKKPVNILRITGREDVLTLLNEMKEYSVKIKNIPIRDKLISSASQKLPIKIVADISKEIIENVEDTQILNTLGISSILYDYKNEKIQPSRDQLQKIKEKLNLNQTTNNQIQILLARDFFIDKIKNIKKEKYCGYVYDLYVPENHNYFCEGIIVHNCIDEIEKMDEHDRSTMHESLEQQCYHKDTIITLADGQEVKIGDLVEKLLEQNKEKIIQGKDCLILPVKSLELLTTDWKKVFPIKASRISKHKAFKKFIKIKFSHGREIIVTPEHPVFTAKEGQIITKRADSIQLEDSIPVPLIMPIKGKQQFFDNIEPSLDSRTKQHPTIPANNCKEIFKIVGYIVSEGSKEKNRGKILGINFANKNEEVIDDFEECMKYVFNLKSYKQVRIDPTGPMYFCRYISRELTRFILKNMPQIINYAGEKEIPLFAMKGEKENIAAMISCLFEGDGYVTIKERTIRIGYSTKSKRLAEQIQDLLLRFKIRSSVTEHKGFYKVGITDYQNIQRFLEEIGFVTQKKNEIIKRYLEEKKIRRYVKNKLPLEFNDSIIKILKEENIVQVGKYRQYDIIYDHQLRKDKFSFSTDFLRNLNIQIKNPKNREFIESLIGDIGWEKVIGIEILNNEDEKWVYDVTIEPNHSFVSQAAILHNTVTISKANIQATLRSETSVLAAGNPKLGRFDPLIPIPQQINISPALLSRFDVIFILRDLPNRVQDEAIARHVLEEHQQEIKRDVFDPKILRKYIAYARKKVKPKLTDEAADEIREFYIAIRNKVVTGSSDSKPIPITARQLEAIVRLSEASAKVRLSNFVTVEDTKRAITLLKYSMMQVGYDEETQSFDIDRVTTGIPTSKRNKIIAVREVISKLESSLGKLIPMQELEKEIGERLSKEEIEDALNQLTKSGDIFKPKSGYIQKL